MRNRMMIVLLTLLVLPMLTGCQPATIVKAVSPPEITVRAGQTLLELPRQVEVVYSNDKREMADVDWLYMQNKRLWEDTTISGKVTGTDLRVTLRVVIKDAEALKLSESELSSSDPLSVMENKLANHPHVELYSVSPDSTKVCYIYRPDPRSEQEHVLYLWPVGKGEACSQIVPITGINFHELEWSADGRFLYAYCSTDVIGSCIVVDMTSFERRTGLATLMTARWAPVGHDLLIAEPNDIQLTVPVGDGCSYDLVIYNAETGKKTVLLPGDADSIYEIVGWDGPDTVVFNRMLVKDGSVERNLQAIVSR